ncbi:phosphate uptake regulator PhoU [Candidatus Woesearchaeota archaeon]|nr:phosphate uptake regulator PhoU [Candidatus Woesearchaeota archaeon]
MKIKRKVIQIAGSTSLISLPKPWIDKHNIKKGSELDLQEQGNKIVVSTDSTEDLANKTLDVTGMDRSTIIFYLRSAYRKGYDSIEILYGEPVSRHLRTGKTRNISAIVHEEVARLVGVEVIQQKENSCLVKSISEPSAKDFSSILRRVFILLKDAFDEVCRGITTGNAALLETLEERHDNITKFISYSLRLLNKKGYGVMSDVTSFYQIVSSLEEITDILKWIAREALSMKSPKFDDRARKVMLQIADAFDQYQDIFYKFDPKKVAKFYETRHDAKTGFRAAMKKIPIEQALTLRNGMHILDILVSITEVRMGIEAPK